MKNLSLLLSSLVLLPALHAQAAVTIGNEIVYQIITDRFEDGDPANNCGQNDPALSAVARETNRFTCDPEKKDWNRYWGGDFQGIRNRLPYLRQLGITTVWISPVIENARGMAVGDGVLKTAYHGFWGRDWFRLNEHWTRSGTRDETSLRELVTDARAAGIGVMLDTVLNHTSPAYDAERGALYENGKRLGDFFDDSDKLFNRRPGIRWDLAEGAGNPEQLRSYLYINDLAAGTTTPERWKTYQQLPLETLQARMLQDYQLADLADLDSSNREVVDYLQRAHERLLDYGISGFRVDTVRHVPAGVQRDLIDKLLARKPDLFVVGEWYGGGPGNPLSMAFTQESGMTIFDFRFREALRDLYLGKRSLAAFTDFLKSSMNASGEDAARDLVTFIDNHDMPRMKSEGATDQEQLEMMKLLFAVRGVPCIYYGTETFLHTKTGGGRDPYNRDMMIFPKEGAAAPGVELLSRLSAFRKKHPALRFGKTEFLSQTKDAVLFKRATADDEVVIAIGRAKKLPAGYVPVALDTKTPAKGNAKRPPWQVTYYEKR